MQLWHSCDVMHEGFAALTLPPVPCDLLPICIRTASCSEISIVNPRRACAARVTVVVLAGACCISTAVLLLLYLSAQ